MKKFKLTTQLIILFSSIFVITCLIFSVLVGSKLGEFSDSQALNSLQTMIDASQEYWEDETNTGFTLDSNGMSTSYIRIFKKDNPQIPGGEVQMIASSNIYDMLGDDKNINNILSSVSKIPGSSGSMKRSIKGYGTFYFAYEVSDNGNAIVVITTSTYASSIRKNMGLQIVGIFEIVIVFAALILFAWSKTYTTRLYRLNTHVKNLPKNNYNGEYLDDGGDEIADLSMTIEEMRNELLHTENDKREMLQNLSHDFKTPIAVIKSYAEAIKDGVESKDGLDTIISQAEMLQGKVTKLLQYNRLEYLTKTDDFSDCDMKSIINNVVKNYKYQQDIKLIVDLDDTLFTGYTENYYTVVDNILDNAKRYAKSVIKITLHDGILEIYNDGDPIDEKFANGLFKAYEKGSKGQFGLGMSIVKKTLDFFGYDISVRNEEVGVTFSIYKKPNQNILSL